MIKYLKMNQLLFTALFTLVSSYHSPDPCHLDQVDSSSIPSASDSVVFTSCKLLRIQDNAFNHLTLVKRIEISHGSLLEFPNITGVGSTLEELRLNDNEISSINPDYLKGLETLYALDLSGNPNLDHLPDVQSLRTVTLLSIGRCGFTRIPALTNAVNLRILNIGNSTKLKIVEKNDFTHLHSLLKLIIWDSIFTSLPDFTSIRHTLRLLHMERSSVSTASPLNTASLRDIVRLDLSDDKDLIILPTLCHENPPALVIPLRGSGVDLCDCRNVWLKESAENGAAVMVDDVKCHGVFWSQLSSANLYSLCHHQMAVSKLIESIWSSRTIDRPCSSPYHSSHYDVTRTFCVVVCMRTPGCQSVNFRSITGDKGECVIVAPSGFNRVLGSRQTTGWEYIGTIKK